MLPAHSFPPTPVASHRLPAIGAGRGEIVGSPSHVQSCDLPQAGPVVTDLTDTWEWWLYFNGFTDGKELMKRGVKEVLIKRTAKSSSNADVQAGDLHIVVTDMLDVECTVVPAKRRLQRGDLTTR